MVRMMANRKLTGRSKKVKDKKRKAARRKHNISSSSLRNFESMVEITEIVEIQIPTDN